MADRGPLDARWDLAPLRHKRHPSAAWAEPPHPLGALLRGMLGITRVIWRHTDTGPMAIPGRPAPSGGGLYPIEAYVASPEGLFHYDPVHEVLEVLRTGDHGPARICLTAVFWRSMFKYGDYAYRLICQEIGVLRTQAEVVAATLDLTVTPADPDDTLLGLDESREALLTVLHVRGLGLDRNRPTTPTLQPARQPEHTSELGETRKATPTARHAPPHERALAPQPAGDLPQEARPLPLPFPPGAAWDLHRAAEADSRTRRLRPPGHVRVPAGMVDLREGLPIRHSPVDGFRPVPVPLAAIVAMAETAAGPDLHLLALRVDGLPRAAYRYDGELRRVDAAPLASLGSAPLVANTREALKTAAAVIVLVGDPLAGTARDHRDQLVETGAALQRATLAAAALGLTSRIHSDAAGAATDRVLGLTGPARSLSSLLVGVPRSRGPDLVLRFPDRQEGGPRGTSGTY
ncbi:nitroreductase family protein [Herbidospora cretacea]|uniref:nitroreductase family protein n=1 Tax=Herbidospora cretacea TaxID=28444 RepID=UPI0012FBF297|nr:nitroreductase family protein [Herbidospora cretacea]